MNILFLTLLDFETIEERNIYTDLLREFVKENHSVYIVSPVEKKKKQQTKLLKYENCNILKLQIGNMQKTNVIEKGISTLTLESKFVQGIKAYFFDVKFDLVIYSTPPITLQKAVEFVKKRDGALTYLLLKDIFPQNAVDLGMLSSAGLRGLIYRYFRQKEINLYNVSDVIGCMSPANVRFVRKHNPQLTTKIIEVCPNSIEVLNNVDSTVSNREIKEKYGIPLNVISYIYGGNLGKPQGIDFLIKCLQENQYNNDVFFVIVGAGTEYGKLEKAIEKFNITNVKLFSYLPKEEYELLASSCDVGLIFLDKRFTIPNFPSRLLSYMQASMPILAATDKNTDIGEIIEEGQFGYWCESNNIEEFNRLLQKFNDNDRRKQMGLNARCYLENNYTARHSYNIIMKHFEKGIN